MACFSGLDALEKVFRCVENLDPGPQFPSVRKFEFQIPGKYLECLKRFSFLGGFFFGDFECADYDGSSVLWMFKCRISITGSSVFLNVFGREFCKWLVSDTWKTQWDSVPNYAFQQSILPTLQ
ncbi:hypothetical protein RhiirC2_793205 [Rhizophagus irregularis]|uniref:Uncharacterized protein n=1 Tax=Rhizophagus irregularis TaxID=588596 RepID=A0A2N1MFU5_9GLOM|nr:hypothetical protein RhiirC2_793205 [Rhizophagus irregularis]